MAIHQYLRPEDVEGVKVEIYRNDARVRYTMRPNKIPAGGMSGERRAEVETLSQKSLKRLAFVAQNTSVKLGHMVTLTYPSSFPLDGVTIKRHLQRFLQMVRRRGLSYLWFLEFQRRGAPHFHVLLTGALARDHVSQFWYRVVGSGDERHLRAGTRCEQIRSQEGAARYVAKYAAKREQKVVPRDFSSVGRFWGHSADVKPEPVATVDIVEVTQVRSLLGDCWAADVFESWAAGKSEYPPSVAFGSTIDKSAVNSVLSTLSSNTFT